MDRRSAVRFAPTEIAKMEKLVADGEEKVLDCNFCKKLAEEFNRSAGRAGSRALKAAQVQGWFLAKFPQPTNKPASLPAAPEEKALDSQVNMSVSEEKASASEVNVSISEDKAAASEEILLPLDTSVSNNGDVVAPSSTKESKDKVPEVDMLEFEAKSSKDSAWYDIATFLAHRKRGDEVEVRVRFEGFGAEEDEWVNVKECVRERSIPLESSQCRSISEGDLVLCFREGNEEALHFDAHVVEIQRKQHDIRGCRCVFLVEYDHDSCQERVSLRRLSRRPKY